MLRRVPLWMSRKLGERAVWYRWFASFYILVCFVTVPLLLLSFSFVIALGPGGVVLNIFLNVLTIALTCFLIYKIDRVGGMFRLHAARDELGQVQTTGV